jgi:hypothetical protein
MKQIIIDLPDGEPNCLVKTIFQNMQPIDYSNFIAELETLKLMLIGRRSKFYQSRK